MTTTYAQFCAVARAAEVLGERWTLLIVRDLLLGPRRFTDLREGLAAIAPSVLTERLTALEERGIVERADAEGPGSGRIYRLTEFGEGLRPTIHELTKWGAQLLMPKRPGERFDPRWMRLAFEAYASPAPTPAVTLELRIEGDPRVAAVVTGGPGGSRVRGAAGDGAVDRADAVDAVIVGSPLALFGAMSGDMEVDGAVADGSLRVEGDIAAARRFPELFAGV